jgi:hypothetical protein
MLRNERNIEKKIGRDGTPIRAAKIRNLDGGTIPVLVSRRKSLAAAINSLFQRSGGDTC